MLMLALEVTPAHAQILLSENFDDGLAAWTVTPGRGSAEVTSYAGNASLHLTRNAAAVRAIDVTDASRLLIAASFAASDLETSDACLIEFSANGRDWFEIGQIGKGQDDAVTLHRVEAMVDVPASATRGYIGVRVAGNADNDSCWADDISVTARPSPANLTRTIAPQTFDSGVTADQPFATSVFVRPANARDASNHFAGQLRFAGGAMAHFTLLKDDFHYAADSRSIASLPAFSIDLLQTGAELVPLIRTPIAGEHPDWEWIFAPGKVWDDPVDKGASRAVLPFTLMERNANCTHNGLASFRFDDHGAISHFVYQIGSETCAYTQFDAWGAGPLTYAMHPVDNAADIVTAYAREKAARMETRPIAALPSAVAAGLGSAEEVKPSSMTAFGYIADNIHYVSGCDTRFGSYEYCDSLVLPSYSWAKSLAAGVAAMRMEKLYPGAMQSLISDYVPACSGPNWRSVRFINALDMASGLYNSAGHEVDEQSDEMRRFFTVESHAEKIGIACTAFARRAKPGHDFVYRTADTYILGTAINAYLRQKTGHAEADYYRDLLDPIWADIGLSPLARTTRRTYDDARQPFSGWGMAFYRQDIALVTAFLQRGAMVDGKPMLDSAMLKAALQRDPDDRGLRAVIDSQRYQHGFWAWNAGPAIGCGTDIWIPALSGFGGLSAALMPNGPVYYYVSDGGDFSWRRAAQASNLYRPFCKEASE